jgi:excisionase family DNA binding protein
MYWIRLLNLRPRTRCAMLSMMTHDTATPVELIRIGDLARLTGLSVSHLRRLADAGLIPSCRSGPGDHRRFPRDIAVQRVRKLVNLIW